MKKYILIIAALFFIKGVLTAQVPDFTQTDCNGVTHHLYDDLSAGKAVILNFCAGWCQPCRISDPKLDTLYREFGSGTCNLKAYGFIFETNIGGEVNTDCNFSNAYAASEHLTFPIFANIGDWTSGLTGTYFTQYGIPAIPAFFIILPNTSDPANSQVKIINDNAPTLLQDFRDSLALGGFTPAITFIGNLCSNLPFSGQLSSQFATGNHWSTGETSQIITINSSGTYTLTNSGGCTDPVNIQFVQPPVPGIASISASTICTNSTVLLNYAIPPGGTTDVMWEYFDPSSNTWNDYVPFMDGPISVFASDPGQTYTFRARVNGGICAPAYSNIVSVSITNDQPGPVTGIASASANQFTCKPYTLSYTGNEANAVWQYYDLNLQYWYTYGPADQGPVSITAAIDPGYANGVFSDLWRVAVPVGDCYSVSDNIVIAIKSTTPVINAVCNGLEVTADPNVTLTGFLWSPGGQTTQTITNAKENVDYSVQVTDQYGCLSTTHQSFPYIMVNENPVIKADTTGPICSGSPVQLSFVGTLSLPACTNASNGQFPAGAFDAPDNSTTIITDEGLAGQYSVINVTAGNLYDFGSLTNDDVNSDNVTITGTNGTTVYATGKGIAEWFAGFTGQVRFYTNGAGCVADNNLRTREVASLSNWTDYNIFNWVPGGEKSPAITETPASTTTYSLNYVDINGCQSSVSLGVTIAAPHTYYVDNDKDGYGSNTAVTLCSETAPPGYSTNNTDCNDNDANVHASPNINIQPIATVCSGNTAFITASSNASNPTYSWYSDVAAQHLLQSGVSASYTTAALNTNTVYYVSVADGAASCSSVLTAASVAVNAALAVAPITYGGSTTVCSAAKVSLSDATSGGTWSASSNAANVSNAGVVTFGTVTVTTTVTIYYTVTGNNCSATVGIPFTVNPPLTVKAITGTTTICGAGGTTTLSDATTGGSWSSSNAAIATVVSTTGVVTGKSIGPVTITYTLSSGGCNASVSTSVTVKASPTVAAISGNNVLIKGSSISLSDATKSGSWSSSNTAIASVSTNGSVKGLSAGTCTIYYTVTSGGCSAVASKAITVYNPLSASVTSGKIVCNGGTTTLTINVTGGSGGYQYSLNVGKFQAGNTYTVTAGTYVVVVKDNMAEQFTISGIVISQPAALGLKLVSVTNVSTKGASNGSFTVSGSGGASPYKYSINGTTYQTSGTFSNKLAGTYTVWVQDACTTKNKLSVTVGTNGKKNSAVQDPSVELQPATDEVLSDGDTKAAVYPNPSITGFTLDLKSSSKETVEIVVMDIMGHALHHTSGDATGTYRFGENFIKGMYFVEVIYKNGIKTLKVIKQ